MKHNNKRYKNKLSQNKIIKKRLKNVSPYIFLLSKIFKVPKGYSAILEKINKCTSKEIADDIAKDFCSINTKKNRQ